MVSYLFWVETARSACSLVSVGACAGDNDLYIAGGDSFGNSVSSVYKWCPGDNQFEDITGLHTPRKQYVIIFLVYILLLHIVKCPG